jgi:hypothetical protein
LKYLFEIFRENIISVIFLFLEIIIIIYFLFDEYIIIRNQNLGQGIIAYRMFHSIINSVFIVISIILFFIILFSKILGNKELQKLPFFIISLLTFLIPLTYAIFKKAIFPFWIYFM